MYLILDHLLIFFVLRPFRIFTFGFNKKNYPSSQRDNFKKCDVAMVNPFSRKILTLPSIPVISMSERMLKHENKHIEQVEKYGAIKFTFLIIYYCIRYGYKNSPLEIEAREAENE